MKTQFTFLVVPFLALACAKDPAAGKEKATVEAAAPVAETKAGEVKKRFAFTAETATLDFVGAKVSAQHEGKFPDVSGVVELTGDTVESGKVKLEVGVASLQIEPAKLAGHLKSPDFFDVEKFPKATFESTSIEKNGDKYAVKGNLNLHGVTKQISFPATIALAGDAVTAKAEFAINRKDFGIVYPGMPDDLIKEEVLIKLNLTAKAK